MEIEDEGEGGNLRDRRCPWILPLDGLPYRLGDAK
jgi:hypothetical protein